jgi:nitroreductase
MGRRFTMNVYKATTKRRSVRRFKNKAISYSALEKCIDAGRLAPSGRNHQLLDYIAINDAQVLPGIFENIGGSAKLPPEKGGPRPDQAAKAYTIVLINKAKEGGDAARRRITLYDVGMAAENIILTALEQGIGCCPILMFNEKDIRLLLEIPDDYDIVLVIAMGYPDEAPVTDVAGESTNIYVDDKNVRHVPKRKLADVLHKNKF